jgi:hypothetical protein
VRIRVNSRHTIILEKLPTGANRELSAVLNTCAAIAQDVVIDQRKASPDVKCLAIVKE